MKKLIYTVAVLGALTATSIYLAFAAGSTWSQVVSIDYVMGDGDSRSSARQAAIEQIKLKASALAGTYIQSTTTMETGRDLNESIQMIGATMVLISDVKDSLSINSSGQTVLAVSAAAKVDGSELTRRIKIMQEDQVKARHIKELKAENDELFTALKSIRKEMSGKLDSARTAELIKQQDLTIRRLSNNSITVTQLFERGTLINMASNNVDALTNAKNDLEENFLSVLAKTPIKATVESVEKTDSGYVALVRTGWEFDEKSINKTLAKYFKIKANGERFTTYIAGYDNQAGMGPHILTEQLYKHLSSKRVSLKLSLSGKTVILPVFFSEGMPFYACDYNVLNKNDPFKKKLCLVTQKTSSQKIHSFERGTSNPLKITLTREEAERATSVEASFFIEG